MTADSPLWHPFTQHQTAQAPINIARACGSYLYDVQGRGYLDAISSWWTNIHGHGAPALVQAIAQQAATLDHVLFAGFTHAPAQQLAQKLTQYPADTTLKKVFFSDNGSTAVEVALKMVLQQAINQNQPQRKTIVAFEGGYHGDTFGAMAVGRGSGFFNAFDLPAPSVHLLPFPCTWHNDAQVEAKELAAITAAQQLFNTQHTHIAGILIEPLLQGAGGMRMCRPQFLTALAALAQQYHIPLIMDEVATGFYRTGTLFAFMQANINPDIICVAKGLSGGILPLGATLTTEAVYANFLAPTFDKAFVHGHSFTANPIACASGVASFGLLHSADTQAQIANIMAWNAEFIAHVATLSPKQQRFFGQLRQCGTVLAFNAPLDELDYGTRKSHLLKTIFLERYINIRPLANVVYIMPPYCLSKAEHAMITNAFLEVAETWHQ